MCGFIVTLLAASLLPVAAAHAAGTPYNTSITNQATATYKDSSANSFEATSNSTTVTVTAVYTVSVTAPPDASGNTNTVVYYPYTVTNTGNNTNTFALSAASGAGGNTWAVALYHDDDGDGVHDAGGDHGDVLDRGPRRGRDLPVLRRGDHTGGRRERADGRHRPHRGRVGGRRNGGRRDGQRHHDGAGPRPHRREGGPERHAGRQLRHDGVRRADPGPRVPDHGDQCRIHHADNVTLTDADGAYTTYVPNSMYIGGNGTAAASNTLQDDDASGGTACASDACGHSSVSGGTVTAYLGTGATESASDARTFAAGSTVYVYFRVTVD
jgi:hypothetical protein